MSYEGFSRIYDRALAPLERWFLRKWRAESFAQLPADALFVELGAGTGLNFAHYPPSGSGVTVEISQEMLEIARSKSGTSDVVRADAQILPFSGDSFDAAIATLVFCSIADPPKAFSELRRVVKNRGRIILLEHVRPPGITGYFFDALSFLTVAVFEDHFNRNTASGAANSGLKIIEVRKKAFGIVNLIVCEVEK